MPLCPQPWPLMTSWGQTDRISFVVSPAAPGRGHRGVKTSVSSTSFLWLLSSTIFLSRCMTSLEWLQVLK